MRSRWKANMWKIVLVPAIAGLIAIGYSLLQGTFHRWLGFDSQGHSVDGQSPTAPDCQGPSPDPNSRRFGCRLHRPGSRRTSGAGAAALT